jgi:hypothetical protein
MATRTVDRETISTWVQEDSYVQGLESRIEDLEQADSEITGDLISAADKAKLDGIEEHANNYTHPDSHPPSIIAQDAQNRFMTDEEREKLAGISDFTNNSAGPIRGKAPGEGADGYIGARLDGTGKVNGWDEVAGIVALVFPVGGMLFQYPDEQTPVERGLPGTWEIWSSRAIIYGIGTSASTTQSYVERQACGNPLTASDLAVGDVISSGTYTGQYITEKITPAGSFFGVEGGNRPAFVSGGKQEDRMRNFTGSIWSFAESFDDDGLIRAYGGTTNPFYRTKAPDPTEIQTATISGNPLRRADMIYLDPSRIVPTGVDNAGPNISCRVWRRIPDINN